MVPGICVYGWLTTSPPRWLNYLTFGFVISHLILAFLSTAGRFFQVSFEFVKSAMMALSFFLLLWYAVPRLGKLRVPRLNRSTIRKIFSAWPLILMILLAGLMSIQRTLSDDDLTYLAFLTNWQKVPHLHFNDVFFGVDKLASVRFWIVSSLFSQTFLSEISGLPGIFLLGGYYEPFLVALSIFSLYELARTLGSSRQMAMAGVIFQITFLALLSEYLHPGFAFFHQLSVDKATATFIVVPAFLQSVVWFLNQPIKRNLILILLTSLSLMAMHPVALFFGVAVAGLIALFGLDRSTLQERLLLLIVLLLVMLPQVAIRFVRHEAQAVIPYLISDTLNSSGIENMISRWGDTAFYGFNPSILAMKIPYVENAPVPEFISKWGWTILVIMAALVALKHIKKDYLAQYIVACFLLVALAGFPFTGWILGYFVSAWMLERTTWLYPYGISLAFLLAAVVGTTDLQERFSISAQRFQMKMGIDLSPWFLATAEVFCIAMILLVMQDQHLPDLTRFRSNSARYREFTAIGQFLDERAMDASFAVGTDELNDFIPAISAEAKVISYRPSDPSYPYFFTQEERNQRKSDRQAIFSKDVPLQDRLSLIEKYDIQFIWLRQGEYHTVRKLVAAFPSTFYVQKIGGYYVLEVRQPEI
ncbi:MAG TPA: hypothetical protein VFZ43_08380, partial [Anaerolineales bacterium]